MRMNRHADGLSASIWAPGYHHHPHHHHADSKDPSRCARSKSTPPTGSLREKERDSEKENRYGVASPGRGDDNGNIGGGGGGGGGGSSPGEYDAVHAPPAQRRSSSASSRASTHGAAHSAAAQFPGGPAKTMQPTTPSSSSRGGIGFVPEGQGLASSYWAPGNQNRRPVRSDWEHRATKSIHSHPPSRERARSHERFQSRSRSRPNSFSSDLSLPYEVQHFILSMMQRILEEACYDFASRWLPDALRNKHWTCSEAVELSSWRDFLPAATPPHALAAVPGVRLDKALADAVRIRNAAVHRHMCTNPEIRRMALHGQDLTALLGDHTRQRKLYSLGLELTEWDRVHGRDEGAARERLEVALRDINDCPIDDMDWSPVAVQCLVEGVEEVTPGGGGEGDREGEWEGDEAMVAASLPLNERDENSHGHGHGHGHGRHHHHHGDAMDLD